MRKSGIDAAYLTWALEDFSIPNFLDWSHGGYFLQGIQGCGKSCLAAAIVSDRMEPEHPLTLAVKEERLISDGTKGMVWEWPKGVCRWYNARDLSDYLRGSWKNEGEGAAIRELMMCKIIVIDDLGTERGTENQDAAIVPAIRRVVDKCIHNGVGLIVTTNHTLKDLRDPRLASRLCTLQEIAMPSIDYRLAARRHREKLVAKPVLPQLERDI